MAYAFRSKILQSLEDANLQAALDGNAARRKQSRTTAYASLPEDLLVMRKRAHAVRAMTTARLESYLEQFITRVQPITFPKNYKQPSTASFGMMIV